MATTTLLRGATLNFGDFMADAPKVTTVAKVMTRSPATATPSETIAQVSARMRDREVGSMVIVDGRRCIGILTERDLVRFAAVGGDSVGTKVSEWMTSDPDTIS